MIYLMRHAESTISAHRRLTCKHPEGDLTSSGQQQAQKAAGWLFDKGITHIYHSPFHRSAQTASIINRRLQLPQTPLDGLREVDCGELEGREDNYSWGLWQQTYERWRQAEWDAAFIGGESYRDAYERFSLSLHQATHAGAQANVLMISHGGLMLCVIPYLCVNAAALQRVNQVENTGFVLLDPYDHGRYVCEAWNLIEHLA